MLFPVFEINGVKKTVLGNFSYILIRFPQYLYITFIIFLLKGEIEKLT